MNIGEFNEQGQLLYLNEGTSDGRGGNTSAVWTKISDTWMKVEMDSGSRVQADGKTKNPTRYILHLRSRRPNTEGDYDPNDYDPRDFSTAVALNEINEKFAIRWRGRLIVLHAVLELQKEWYKIEGYALAPYWQPSSTP